MKILLACLPIVLLGSLLFPSFPCLPMTWSEVVRRDLKFLHLLYTFHSANNPDWIAPEFHSNLPLDRALAASMADDIGMPESAIEAKLARIRNGPIRYRLAVWASQRSIDKAADREILFEVANRTESISNIAIDVGGGLIKNPGYR